MKYRSWFYILLLAGVGISLYYILLFANTFHITSDSFRLSATQWTAIGIATVMQLCAHLIRAYKSRLLLQTIRPTKVRTLFKGLSIGYMYNAMLPFRMGEFIRAHIIGKAMSISRTAVFLTIVVERSVDGIILSLVGLALLFSLVDTTQYPLFIFMSVGILIVSLIIIAGLTLLYRQEPRMLRLFHSVTKLFNSELRDKVRLIIWSGIYGLHTSLSGLKKWRYLLLSVIMWGLYFGSIALVILSFYPNAQHLNIAASSVSPYTSVAIPSGPAYIGTYHFYFSQTINSLLHGNDVAQLSIITWSVLIIPVSVVGIALLAIGRKNIIPSASGRLDMMKNKLFRENDITSEFSHFLDAYFSGNAVNQVVNSHELKDHYRLIKTFKGGSNAITLLVWQNEALNVKKITLPQFRDKLRAQYEWLENRSNIPHLPRVSSEHEETGSYSFNLNYSEDYIPFFEYIHTAQLPHSKAVLDRVINFMYKNIYRPQAPESPRHDLDRYIAEKILGKIDDTAKLSPDVAALLDHKKLVINKLPYDNLEAIIGKIQKHKQAMADLTSFSQSPIHGDLTIDNIIVSEKGDFIVLDPNNENQVSDPVVDMGKLYQSLHSGYEFMYNLDKAYIVENAIMFEENISQKYSELFAALQTKLKNDLDPGAYRSILFHEAVHYCRMLTYRANINPGTVAAFYAVAVRLFNQYYQQYAISKTD